MENQQPPVRGPVQRSAAQIKTRALQINQAINEQVVAINLANPANFITEYLANKQLPTIQQMRDANEPRRKVNAQQKNIDVVYQMLTYMSRFQQQMDSQKFRLMLFSYLKTYFMTADEYTTMVANVRRRFNRAGMKGVQVTNRNQLPQFLQPLYDGITVPVYISKSGKITLDRVPVQNRKIKDRGAYWAFRTAIKAYNKYNKFKRIVNQLLANPQFEESRADFKKVKNLIKGSGLFKHFLQPDAQRTFDNFQQFQTVANQQSKQIKQEKFARARLTVANNLVSLHQNGYRNQAELNQLFNFQDRAIQRRNPGGGGGGGGGDLGGGGGGGDLGGGGDRGGPQPPRNLPRPEDNIFDGEQDEDDIGGQQGPQLDPRSYQPIQTVREPAQVGNRMLLVPLPNRSEALVQTAVRMTVQKISAYVREYPSLRRLPDLVRNLLGYIPVIANQRMEVEDRTPITGDNAEQAIEDITKVLNDSMSTWGVKTIPVAPLVGYGQNQGVINVINVFRRVYAKFSANTKVYLNTYSADYQMPTEHIQDVLGELMYLGDKARVVFIDEAGNLVTQVNQGAAIPNSRQRHTFESALEATLRRQQEKTTLRIVYEIGLMYFINIILKAGYTPDTLLMLPQ